LESRLKPAEVLALAGRVLAIESQAVQRLAERLDQAFVDACTLCLETTGRVVVTGMGKSGHIGRKIAATLASTGTPAFYMHPAEASHGDLGMLTGQDLLLAVSNSGETQEIITILPLIKRMGARLVSMTGKPGSTLARAADVHLDIRGSRAGQPPAPPRRSRWVTRWRLPCSRAAVSRPRILRCHTPAARSASACCCVSPTSCIPAMRFPP